MAGIYDRFQEDMGLSDIRLPWSLMNAVMMGYASGKLTSQQTKDQLNDYLTRNNKPTLTPDEETDLTNIAAEINTRPDVTTKLNYCGGQLFVATVTAETGNTQETGFRVLLDIPPIS
jgi:hypothetical protein